MKKETKGLKISVWEEAMNSVIDQFLEIDKDFKSGLPMEKFNGKFQRLESMMDFLKSWGAASGVSKKPSQSDSGPAGPTAIDLGDL